jgi:hypothetical protein
MVDHKAYNEGWTDFVTRNGRKVGQVRDYYYGYSDAMRERDAQRAEPEEMYEFGLGKFVPVSELFGHDLDGYEFGCY